MQHLVNGTGIIVELNLLLAQQFVGNETKSGGDNTRKTKYNKQLTIHRIVGDIEAEEYWHYVNACADKRYAWQDGNAGYKHKDVANCYVDRSEHGVVKPHRS